MTPVAKNYSYNRCNGAGSGSVPQLLYFTPPPTINAHWKDPQGFSPPAPSGSPPTADAWVSSPSLGPAPGPAPACPCAHVPFVLGSPEWDTALQIWIYQNWVEGQDHLPKPAGNDLPNARQDTIGLLDHKGTASSWLTCPPGPLGPSHRAAFQQVDI